jgi:ribose-phosphate pyrophosphokinase
MDICIINMPDDAGVKYDIFRYPAGETQVRIKSKTISALRTADRVIIRAAIDNGEVMALALLSDAVDHLLAPGTEKFLTLPYLPYSRADRRFTEGDCFGLKAFGNVINGLRFDKVLTFDVHSPIARKYIANLKNLSPETRIKDVLKKLTAEQRLGILLPDKGAVRYDFVNSLILPIFQADKIREPQTGKLSGFSVPTGWALKDIDALLIVDDICDGGGTFVGIADELKKVAPQTDLYLYVSHGIFSAGLGRLGTAFKKIFTTDSFIKNITLEKESAGLVEIL